MLGKIVITCLLYLSAARIYPVPLDSINKGNNGWLQSAKEELERSLRKQKLNTNVAKNVILFVGDGMGFSTSWAARVYTGQYIYGQSGEEYQFSFEKFDHVGLSKVYSVDNQVPDSASTATAFLSGVKANIITFGVNENVKAWNCSNVKGNEVSTILDWSLLKDKSVGIVTTTSVTHGTPGAAYGHTPARFWESDTDFEKPYFQPNGNSSYNKQFGCRDIALQLVEDNANINVILGGGRENFLPKSQMDREYNSKTGERSDGRDLIEEWMQRKNESGSNSAFVWNKSQLEAIDPSNTDYLLGLFEPYFMQYELEHNTTTEPTLAEMTKKAIEILQRNKNGFFLMVEGGMIDQGHHIGVAKKALHETYALDKAVKVATELTNTEDTLIVVTADHSHSFTSSGFPSRGNDILGIVDTEFPALLPVLDNMPYLTLSYANGPNAPINSGRRNVTNDNTTANDYKQTSTVPIGLETHSGEDVPIYASGPMAHLFNGVHEQNYIAYVMGYASCVGMDQRHCDKPGSDPPNTSSGEKIWHWNILLLLSLLLYHY